MLHKKGFSRWSPSPGTGRGTVERAWDLPVAGDELTATFIAVEAFQVKHRVASPHDQFVRGYLVAAAPADTAAAEHSATETKRHPTLKLGSRSRLAISDSRHDPHLHVRKRIRYARGKRFRETSSPDVSDEWCRTCDYFSTISSAVLARIEFQ